ncbi:cytochrome c oxidase subunit 6b-3-like isoform X2 [Panicum virgatum]|uniref:Cytochrome c oxidase subunit n=1 Tax=Panicum virgatum TaxID=38727 RepID=A0A8T0XWP7_PANVG|nr:cytochrome c oxidase subunit 6b-3-like isoform X2 [Panicum virgatum]KAG2659709.1 hypothetical protein PVAP13_1KG377900 [Panicum virgatum]
MGRDIFGCTWWARSRLFSPSVPPGSQKPSRLTRPKAKWCHRLTSPLPPPRDDDGNPPPSPAPAPLRATMAEIEIKTAPADFRFPTTNQTRHCFTRYVEYHRCVNAKGDDAGDCDKFAKYYRSLCPGEWVEKWNEQRENGTFPGPL